MNFDFFKILSDLSALLPGGAFIYTVFVFAIVLGILVFVHEWGHYAAAKSVGIKVEVFSIGFGKSIWQRTDKAGTLWKICLIPLGGYVQMKGQADGKPIKGSKNAPSDSFAAKTLWQRSWAVFAGPLGNFVLALVVFSILMWVGERKLMPQVGELQPNMPAIAAGLQTGDIIQVINDTAIEDWETLQKITNASAGKQLHLIVKRNGNLFPLTLTPQEITFKDLLGDEHTVGRVGIAPSGEAFVVKHNVFKAVVRGAEKTYEITVLMLKSLYKLIIGAIPADNIAGPLGIADLAGDSAANGTYALLIFLAIISLNLGIVNLLPVPILDGGHLMFFLIEAIKGSPVSEAAQTWSLRIGITLILMLVIFATSNDLKRLKVFDFLKQSVVSTDNLAK